MTIRSMPPNKNWDDNYDRVFRGSKKDLVEQNTTLFVGEEGTQRNLHNVRRSLQSFRHELDTGLRPTEYRVYDLINHCLSELENAGVKG